MNNRGIIKRKKEWDKVVDASTSLNQAVMRNDNFQSLESISAHIADKLDLRNNDTLLDIGCGTGVLTNLLSKMCKKSNGVDFSSQAIERAKDKFPKIDFSISEAINLPFPDSSFDKILSYSIFHYFPNQSYAEETLREMLRVSKPQSYILIGDLPSKTHYFSSPNYKRLSFLSNLKKNIKRFLGLKKRPIIQDRRLWFWPNLDQLKSYLESLGCEVNISKVPPIHQYTEKTDYYRFDILVNKSFK